MDAKRKNGKVKMRSPADGVQIEAGIVMAMCAALG
jgi:hypothetical protein